MKEIVVTIGPDAELQIETKGFVGDECIQASSDSASVN